VVAVRKVIVLAGVSGVGKTHARLTDPALKDLPCVDIADVYCEYPEFDWMEAFFALARRVRTCLEQCDTVIVEGYFLPGSTTRQ